MRRSIAIETMMIVTAPITCLRIVPEARPMVAFAVPLSYLRVER
jgi:hypothetical protein